MPQARSEIPARIARNIGLFVGREWLLPHLLEWFERSDERIFLLTGEPGSGKSMVSAWLAGYGPTGEDPETKAHLERLRSRVQAAHFCVASSGLSSSKVCATVLANQLTRRLEGFGSALASSLADRAQIVGTAHADAINADTGAVVAVTGVHIGRLDLGALGDEVSFDRILREPLKKLYSGHRTDPIILLIDGLDEAATYTGDANLVRLLAKLDDFPAPVRFFMTTRADQRILKYYRRAKRLDLIHNAPTTSLDIERYGIGRLAALSQSSRTALTRRIVSAAEGNFLYAFLVISEILENPSRTTDTLNIPLPAGLSGLYLDFLNRHVGIHEDEWEEFFKPVLGVIAVSQGDGLTRKQLEEIISEDVDRALRICSQYLHGTVPDGPFRVFHTSFGEYLLNDSKNVDYHIDATAQHRRIANYCQNHCREADNIYCIDFFILHSLEGHESSAARSLLTDIDWLTYKAIARGIDAVLNDFRLYMLQVPATDFEIDELAAVLKSAAHILRDDPAQLALQIILRSPPGSSVAALSAPGAGSVRIVPVRSGYWATEQARSINLRNGLYPVTCAEIVVEDQKTLGFLGTSGGTVLAIDVESGKLEYEIKAHDDDVRCLAVSKEASLLATGSGHWLDVGFDISIKLWDLTTGRHIRTLMSGGFGSHPENSHVQPIGSLAFARGGEVLISGGWDKEIRVWDAESTECLITLRGHTEGINAIAISADQTRIVSGSADQTIRVWDLTSGEELLTVAPKLGRVLKFAKTANLASIIALTEIAALVVDIGNGELSILYADRDGPLCVDELGDGSFRAISHSGCLVLVQSPNARIATSYLHQKLDTAATDQNASWAVGSYRRSIFAINLLGLSSATTEKAGHHRGRILAMATSCAGSAAASVGADGEICTWSSPNWQYTSSVSHQEVLVCAVALDQSRILTLGDEKCKIWRLEAHSLECECETRVIYPSISILGQDFRPRWSEAVATSNFILFIEYDMFSSYLVLERKTGTTIDLGTMGGPRGFDAMMGDAAGAPLHNSKYYGFVVADYGRDLLFIDLNVESDLLIINAGKRQKRQIPRHRLYGGLDACQILPSSHCLVEVTNGSVAILDYDTGTIRWEWDCGAVSIFACDRADAVYALTGHGEILRLNAATGQRITYTMKDEPEFGLRILSVHDGRWVILVDNRNFISVYDLHDQCVIGVIGFDSLPMGCALSPGGSQLLIAEEVGRLSTIQLS